MPNGTRNITTTSGWVGWVYFAGILLILRGLSQGFLGITALINDHYLLVANNALVSVTADTAAWGWVHLIAGILLLGVGFSVMHGGTFARAVAVFLAGASFLVNMAFLAVFPVWSIVMMIVDALIIYAVVVHGDEVRG